MYALPPAEPSEPESSPLNLDDHPAGEQTGPRTTVVARLAARRNQRSPLTAAVAEELMALAARHPSLDVEIRVEVPSPVEQPSAHVPRLRALPDADGELLRLVVPSRIAIYNGAPLELTRTEFDLLLFLSENPGRVYDRLQLLRAVWGVEYTITTRTVDVHIRRLRVKLGPNRDWIATLRGVGYRFDGGDRVHVEHQATSVAPGWL